MKTILWLDKCSGSVTNNLPDGMNVRGDLRVGTNGKPNRDFTKMPKGLKVGGGLYLNGCESLQYLPKGLRVGGWLNLWYCDSLQSLPRGLKVGGELNIEHCKSLTSIPDDLEVRKEIWIDPNAFCGTGVRKEDFPERLWKQIKYRF